MTAPAVPLRRTQGTAVNDTQRPGLRMTWMDLVRGGAILLVVFWHAASVPDQLLDGAEPGYYVRKLNAALGPFRIPTLLVLSGLLVERSLAKGTRRYVTGKLRHVAWPYAVWLTIIFATMGWLSSLTHVKVWLSGGILWYMVALLFCYAAAMLRPRWMPWLLFAALPLAVLWLVEPGIPILDRYLWYGAFFFFGAAVGPHLATIQTRMPIWAAALLALVTLGGGYIVAKRLLVSQTPEYLPVSLAGILFVLWLAPRIPRWPLTRLLEWYGRNSIVMYVGHAFASYATVRVLDVTGTENMPYVIPLMMITTFGVPTLLVLARRRIEWLFVFPELRRSRPAALAPRHLAVTGT